MEKLYAMIYNKTKGHGFLFDSIDAPKPSVQYPLIHS